MDEVIMSCGWGGSIHDIKGRIGGKGGVLLSCFIERRIRRKAPAAELSELWTRISIISIYFTVHWL